MILIIDNVDSFVHNLARYFRNAGAQTKIVRHNEVSIEECLALHPAAVVISPGPNTPSQAGISLSLIEALPPTMPFLGVCLGHQCLIEAFGGKSQRAKRPLHGEASQVSHHGEGIFDGLPSPILAGRYHSLIASPPSSGVLVETAWSEEGEVMAVKHRDRPWFGVQFHPESLLTPYGQDIIDNFLKCN